MDLENQSGDVEPPALMLSYAPPVRGRFRRYLVLPFGLLTTAIALLGVYFYSRWKDTNVMGWHFLFVIPVGALIVGAVSGIGYLISAGFAGVRIRRSVVLTIILIQIVAYFAAQYIEFRVHGPFFDLATRTQVGFWKYFHILTTSMAWVGKGNNSGEALGGAGYIFTAIEIAGFVFGGVFWLGALSSTNYCELCSRYRDRKLLTVIPASPPYPKELNEETQPEFEEQSTVLMQRAELRFEQLDRLAAEGDVQGFLEEIESGREESKGATKLPTRIRIELTYCPNCYDGSLEQFVQMGQEVSVQTTMLPTIPCSREFVSGVVRPKKMAKS